MPGVGIGGLISNFMNPGLDQTIAKQITPDPSPLAQQGQGQGPGQAGGAPTDQSGNAYARAAVTQQDPVAASLAENLVKAQRQSMYAADLNRNLEGVAAGFGTAAQQASKQAALRGAGGGGADEIGMWQGIQGINKEQAAQNDRARFMGNIHVFAQSLSTAMGRPVSDAEAMELASSPDMSKEAAQAFGANSTLTGATKDADQATASWKAANPNATPAQVAAYRAGIIALGSGASMDDQAYRAYAQAEVAAGRTPMDSLAWKNQHATEADISKKQGLDATAFKDNGIQDFDQVDQKLKMSEANVKTLLADLPATMRALSYPGLLTTSDAAAFFANLGISVPKNIKDAAVAAQQLKAALTGESLSTIKNLRNRREFDTLGTSATAGLNANLGEEGVKKVLEGMEEKFATAHANAYAVAGKTIPNQYTGKADERYLNPTWEGVKNPYYTGATYEPPDSKGGGGGGDGGGPGPAPDAPAGGWPTPEDWQIQRLRANPDKAADFDKKFGPGSAKRVLGR